MRKSLRLLSAAAVVACAGFAAVPASAQSSKLHFRAPVYVDTQLAGSEGFVMYAAKSHRLIYATHEGTTLLLRGGLTGAPSGDGDYLSDLPQPGQHVDLRQRRTQLAARQLERHRFLHRPRPQPRLLRPRPDRGRRRQHLRRRHRPRERLARVQRRRRAHLADRHRAVPRGRPAVARGRQGQGGVPRQQQRAVRPHRRTQHRRRRDAAHRRSPTARSTTGPATASSSTTRRPTPSTKLPSTATSSA